MLSRRRITFKQFVTLQRGFDLPKKDRVPGPYPVVASASIVGWHNEHKVNPPGVVTGRSGTLGEVLYLDQPLWPLNTTLWVKDFKGNDPRYVYYFMKTMDLRRFNAGTGVPTLNRNHLDTLEVHAHDLDTQRRIASILWAYDVLIENNTRRVRILEEMGQVLFKGWFGHFCILTQGNARAKGLSAGRMAKGWKLKTIDDALFVRCGFAFKSSTFSDSGDYAVATIGNVQDGEFVPDCENHLATPPSQMPQHCHLITGDILLSLTGNVGRVCLVYGDSYLLNQRVAKLVPVNSNHRAFVYFVFRQEEVRKRLELISTGVAQQNLSPVKIGKLRIALPPDASLEDFSASSEPIIDQILVLYLQNRNLRRTRDFLLWKLISGEIDVSELEIDMEAD